MDDVVSSSHLDNLPGTHRADSVSLLFSYPIAFSAASKTVVRYEGAQEGSHEGDFLPLVATGMVTSGETCSAPRQSVFVSEEVKSLVNESLEVKATVEIQEATILIVDDNRELHMFLAAQFEEAGWIVLTAETAQQARELVAERHPTTVLLDYLLGEEDGLALGLQLQTQAPGTQIIIMTGGVLTDDDLTICEEREVPVLYKPFRAKAVVNLVRGQHHRASAAAPC